MQLTRMVLMAAAVAGAEAQLGGRGSTGSSVIDLQANAVGANSRQNTFTLLFDNVKAFSDLDNSVYRNVPLHLKGLGVATPERFLPQGFKLRWTCPTGLSAVGCDAFLFLYECGACPSQKGALPSLLNSNGWERSRCAPQFTTGTGSGQTHKMTAYKKIVAEGVTEEVELPNKVEFVSTALSQTSVDCTGFDSQAACEDASLLGHCQWNLAKSTCHLARCVGYGPNPQGCLSQCVGDDLP